MATFTLLISPLALSDFASTLVPPGRPQLRTVPCWSPLNSRRHSVTTLRWGCCGGYSSIRSTTQPTISPPRTSGDRTAISTYARNLSELYSLAPDSSVRWIVSSLLPQGPIPGPIVSPANDVVLMGGQQTYGRPG